MKVRDGAIVQHDDDIDFSGLYDKESLDDFWANDFDKFAPALRQLGLQAHRLSSVWINIAVLYDGADVPWQRKLSKRWSARCVNQVRFAPKFYNRSFSAFSCDFNLLPIRKERQSQRQYATELIGRNTVTMYADEIKPLRDIVFHGLAVKVPRSADKLLRQAYGAWKKRDCKSNNLPAPRKRTSCLRRFSSVTHTIKKTKCH